MEHRIPAETGQIHTSDSRLLQEFIHEAWGEGSFSAGSYGIHVDWFQLIKPLEYDNRIEHAGGLVTDIVLLLIPVVDLAVEAKAATLLDTILAKFVATSAKEVLAEGEFLEAQTVGGDVVRIFKNKGDGTPTGLHGELQTEGLKESIRETGK
jgi:hypothetical protein